MPSGVAIGVSRASLASGSIPGAGRHAYVLRVVSSPALMAMPRAITAMTTAEKRGAWAICRRAKRTSPAIVERVDRPKAIMCLAWERRQAIYAHVRDWVSIRLLLLRIDARMTLR